MALEITSSIHGLNKAHYYKIKDIYSSDYLDNEGLKRYKGVMTVHVYHDKDKISSLLSNRIDFDVAKESETMRKSLYPYLKTLEDFEGATDV